MACVQMLDLSFPGCMMLAGQVSLSFYDIVPLSLKSDDDDNDEHVCNYYK